MANTSDKGGSWQSASTFTISQGPVMSDLTYGRDSAGKKKLLTDYQNDLKNAIKVLEDESNNVILTVRRYWAGADADTFVSIFEKDVKNVKTQFKTYSSLIQEALDSDAKQFSKNQNTIANMIKK